MSYTLYNSRDSYYKSKFGAVKTLEKVKFRIVLPRSFMINGATLAVRNDNEESFSERGMYWAGMYGDDSEVWDIEIDFPKSGLYWYHFNLYSSWGEGAIYNSGNGIGVYASAPGAKQEWQLTVYEKDFETPEWLCGGVIYQIFPDRFYNSGVKKDNVPSDRILRTDTENAPYWKPDVLNRDYFGGDLKGIEQKLGYLSDLGVTCIYLNPIFEAHSNHRYNTADYLKIDPLLGTEKDFVSLCRTAHRFGIKVILDGVFSHTGDDSVYFNRYGRYNSVGAYNSKESPYCKWYKFEEYPDKYKSWWGFDTLPEVTEECPDYLEFITGKNGVLRKWLKLGADGWRLDVADELPDCFIDAVRKAVKEEKPDALLLGEVWEDATNKFSYGYRRKFLLGAQFDSVMNYPFANAVLDFARDGLAEDFMSRICSIVENYPEPALNVLMNHIGTHDTERAITRLAGERCDYHDRAWQSSTFLSDEKYKKGVKLLKLAAAIQYMLPGVPSVYYGDEAGMQGYKDPFNRGYFIWGSENTELQEYYSMLGEIRQRNSALKHGKFAPVSAALGCVAFERNGEHSSLMLIANRNETEITYNLPNIWQYTRELINRASVTDSVTIPAVGAVILKRKH